jgi:hypothetical protein
MRTSNQVVKRFGGGLPIAYLHGPRLADVVQREAEQFEYGVIGRKQARWLDGFPQAQFHRPNRVVRVNCFSNAGG